MKVHILPAAIIIVTLLLLSCGAKPKVIEASASSSSSASPAYHTMDEAGDNTDMHTVVCQDFLHTDKYTYMDVTENGNRFWIAVPRSDVVKGGTYSYTGGLKKANFKSTEYDRVFETIYLVSGITQAGGSSGGGSAVDRALAHQQNPEGASTPVNLAPRGDLVKIKDLFDNRAKYEGMVVTVKGRCVKINKMIMGRNWVHIDDGSLKDGGDLTVTTMADVPLGSEATMTGTIGLNRDFGAGYMYEVIMEDAVKE